MRTVAIMARGGFVTFEARSTLPCFAYNGEVAKRILDNPPHAVCSFCGKPRAETGRMVEGPVEVYICRPCADLVQTIFELMDREERENKPAHD